MDDRKTIYITDHAMLRYLERVRGLDIEQLRAELSRKATRAWTAAESIGGGEYAIKVDGFRMRVQSDHVVTILAPK